ncbi:hypothetical protein [Mesorhizobium sp. M0138]|uniref:hypothetical protein n=1 Tax=Mesorhizobium sp. M0138 TaxID=2956891 RepID=UPI00333CC0B0
MTAVIAAQTMVSGCAIRPLPEEVTGVDTFGIVNQIRCEMRQSIRNTLVDYLTGGEGVDDPSRQIGRQLKASPDEITRFSPSALTGNARKLVSLFWSSGIAYNFELDMKLDNQLSASTSFLDKFPARLFELGVDASLDRSRQNTREFTVTDKVDNLIAHPPYGGCRGKIVGPNYIYPIAGQIGVEGMLHNFVYLSLLGNLAAKKDATGSAPTITETLNFETTISGTASPKVVFNPLPERSFRLAEAALVAETKRIDTHKVIIGLSIPESANSDFRDARGQYEGQFLSATGDPTSLNAARAVDRSIARKAFQTVVQINTN